ncbi:hypothetical protein I546_6910 [Mycobacterium kansasii 732]|nr:hypothetical protein I546_6910 [Mycobacterium kansasii 732]
MTVTASVAMGALVTSISWSTCARGGRGPYRTAVLNAALLRFRVPSRHAG